MEGSKDDVVGWGRAGAAWTRPEARTASRAIAEALHAAGVRHAFGVLGGGIAGFAAGLASSPIEVVHCRHEAGAGFAALEAWFETGRPGLVVATTGPGLFNTLNAMMAARIDGARLLLVSGFTSRPMVGRGAVQETSIASMPADVLRAGSIFHDVALPETVEELAVALARITRGLQGARPYVAHLGLPLSLQTQLLEHALPAAGPWRTCLPTASSAELDECLARMADASAVLWLGHGARGASKELRAFAEAAHLPVISSPRAKGVFPEAHPLFVGVSGAGGSPRVNDFFAARRPTHALVIGSRLGEVTTFLSPALCPTSGWIQVDLDPAAFGGAFPGIPGLGIVADARGFAAALDARATEQGWYARRPRVAVPRAEVALLSPRAADVRPPYLMQVIQERIVRRTDALVMSEAGTSFTWCNAQLQFAEPGRYRTSAAWGSMGHFTTGCVGAALAGQRRVVAVVGDGAMLMNNEINTAVGHAARVMWIVLNDAQYGLTQHGMEALGMVPVATQFPRTDFVAFARAQGADGIAVRTELDLAAAIDTALASPGPFVVDVTIDRTVASPVVAARVASLRQQQGAA